MLLACTNCGWSISVKETYRDGERVIGNLVGGDTTTWEKILAYANALHKCPKDGKEREEDEG